MATPERGSRRQGSRRKASAPLAVVAPALPEPRPVRGLLPALDPASGEALRDFFRVPRWWLLDDGAAVQARPGAAPGSAFVLDAEGTALALHVDGPAAAGEDDARLRWSDHAGRARVLAWSLAHEPLLRRLSEWLGASLLPRAEEGPAEPAAGMLWLALRVEDPLPPDAGPDAHASATTARLRLPAAWLPRIAARAEPPHEDDPPPDAGRWRALPAAASLQFTLALPAADWRALRPGDVIVAGRRDQPPACFVRAAGRDWPVAPAAGGWAVRAEPTPSPGFHEESPMSEHEHAGDAPAGTPAPTPDPARALPVQVGFELGRAELTVGELADIQPGYVFPLAAAIEGGNVTIRANGQVAGRGELVAVGDTLGVRLLSWS